MKKILLTLSLGFVSLIFPLMSFAAVPIVDDRAVNLEPNVDQVELIKLSSANFTVPNLIRTGISIALISAALIFFFILVIGGIRWIMSGGEKGNVENARKQITNALIGLAIVFVAWAISRLLANVFNVDIFNFTLPQVGK